MTNSELYLVVRQMVHAVTGLPLDKIVAQDPECNIKGEYCAIKINGTARERGRGSINFGQSDIVSSPIGDVRNLTSDIISYIERDVTLNFYRGAAHDYARSMTACGRFFSVRDVMLRNGVGLLGRGVVNDLTALQSDSREPRAEITLTIATTENYSDEINAVYGVSLIAENEKAEMLATVSISAPTE